MCPSLQNSGPFFFRAHVGILSEMYTFGRSTCSHCEGYAQWLEEWRYVCLLVASILAYRSKNGNKSAVKIRPLRFCDCDVTRSQILTTYFLPLVLDARRLGHLPTAYLSFS